MGILHSARGEKAEGRLLLLLLTCIGSARGHSHTHTRTQTHTYTHAKRHRLKESLSVYECIGAYSVNHTTPFKLKCLRTCTDAQTHQHNTHTTGGDILKKPKTCAMNADP